MDNRYSFGSISLLDSYREISPNIFVAQTSLRIRPSSLLDLAAHAGTPFIEWARTPASLAGAGFVLVLGWFAFAETSLVAGDAWSRRSDLN